MEDSTPRTAAGIRRRAAASKAQSQGGQRPPTQPGSMMKMYEDSSPGIKMYFILILVIQ
jgi:hypothetical protein